MSNSKDSDAKDSKDSKDSDAKDSKDTKDSDAKDSKDAKDSDAKDSKETDDEDASLVDTATTKAKKVVGLMAEKAADMIVSAGKKIEETRKEE